MDKKMKYSLLFVFLLFSIIQLHAQQYKLYCNGRFGFCFSYPKDMISDPPPDNGDGICVRDSHGLVITCSGIANALFDSLQSQMESTGKRFDKISYKAKGKNWFVLSGFNGNKIIYIKTFIGKEYINDLSLEYPKEFKDKYDKIVSKVVRSFKSGDLDNIGY
jgi:hypothetical protein